MTNVKERVAYLQGLTKGLDVDARTPEGKVILNILDVLEDMAEDVQDMFMAQHELETYVETIDEDLNDLEEDFYEEFDCSDEEFVEMQCPTCHEEVSFESDLLDEHDPVEVTCPHCGNVVYDNFAVCSHHSGHGDHYKQRYIEHPGN